MIHPDRYPFLALLLPVIAGIAASERVTPAPETCYIIVGTSLAALLLTFLVRRLRVWLLLPVAVILFTVALSRSRPPESSVIPGEIYLVEGARVTEVRGNRYVVRLRDYNLYLQPGDTLSFIVGDLLTFRARLFPPGRPVDLHEFSRDRYMRQLNVHFRAIPLAGIRRVGHRAGLYSRCQEARTFLGRKLETTVRDTTTRALLQALCLGDRSLVSTRVQTLFSESGTVHLLAVSGLHMGALYLLLNFFLGLARLHPRLRAACALPLLWVFAGITGLSPPTVRAATIITLLIVGRLLDRDYNAINALCASAFFTLLLSPHLLHSASFLMSHAAYAGIILILPAIRIDWKKRTAARLYSLLAMSLAAQIGALPLVAYYFHSINLNSLLVNVIAVPIATCLLYVGIIFMALPSPLAALLDRVPEIIQRTLLFILEQNNRLAIPWRDLYPTPLHLFFFYLIVLFLIAYLKRRSLPLLLTITTTCALFLLYHGALTYTNQRQQELVIYDRPSRSQVLLNHHGHYTFLLGHDTLPPPYAKARQLKPFPAPHGFISNNTRLHDNRLTTPRLTLYIVDDAHTRPDSADILLVTGNLYPDRLTGSPSPTRLIIDRSNTFSCTRSWEQWGEQRGIPVEKIIETGSIIIPLD